jgi:hypothetical protein
MDHFTLSASQNVQEWSTDVSGYGNLAGEFMKTPECHAAVVAWTALVKKYQCTVPTESLWKPERTLCKSAVFAVLSLVQFLTKFFQIC